LTYKNHLQNENEARWSPTSFFDFWTITVTVNLAGENQLL